MTEWVYRNEDGTETDPITDAEWKRRYAARLMERCGMPERAAIECAKEGYRLAVEEYMTDLHEGLADPIEAADEEMSNWENDGEDDGA